MQAWKYGAKCWATSMWIELQRSTTAFNAEFQDLITRYAWGEIWTRPGLPRHTRSLLTVALMVALNRNEEFSMHVRASANNGVTRDEIKETLLQCAIYCGVPAANSCLSSCARRSLRKWMRPGSGTAESNLWRRWKHR